MLPQGLSKSANQNSKWKTTIGTSFATPMVAATIAGVIKKFNHTYSSKGWPKKYLFNKASKATYDLNATGGRSLNITQKDDNDPFVKDTVYILDTSDLHNNSSFTNWR